MDMMATMKHENIVQYVGYVECNREERDQIRFLIEFVNQGSLDKLLEKDRLTDRGKVRLLMHVAKGMTYLHDLRIIHRDLAASEPTHASEPTPRQFVGVFSGNILVHKRDNGTIVAKVWIFTESSKPSTLFSSGE